MDFRARRKDAAAAGEMDEGIAWVAQVDGGLFRSRAHRKRKRSQLFTVLGDVEFADDTVTCASASYAPAVELFDATLQDWSQRRNAHNVQSVFLLCRMPLGFRVGEPVAGCSESRPRVSVVRHVGGLLSADGRVTG